MFNDVVLVGRLVDEVRVVKVNGGQHVANITLAVQRPFKNENNDFDTDYVPVQIWRWVADIAEQYCTKGTMVLIKGRVACRTSEVQGVKVKNLEIIGERLIILENRKKEIENVDFDDEEITEEE